VIDMGFFLIISLAWDLDSEMLCHERFLTCSILNIMPRKNSYFWIYYLGGRGIFDTFCHLNFFSTKGFLCTGNGNIKSTHGNTIKNFLMCRPLLPSSRLSILSIQPFQLFLLHLHPTYLLLFLQHSSPKCPRIFFHIPFVECQTTPQ